MEVKLWGISVKGLFMKRKNFTEICKAFEEHETGFEPATLALARRYSTTEPLVRFFILFLCSLEQYILYMIQKDLSTEKLKKFIFFIFSVI